MMGIEQLAEEQYRIARPGFEHVVFGGAFLRDEFVEMIEHAQARGMVLQSAQEAAALRIESLQKQTLDLKLSMRNQATRTTAIYFQRDGEDWVAFDDAPDPKQNLLLKRAAEWKQYEKEGKPFWYLPIEDPDIQQVLERAMQQRRATKVRNLWGVYTIVKGKRPFGASIGARMLFGEEISKAYDGFLHYLHAQQKYTVKIETPEMGWEGINLGSKKACVLGVLLEEIDRKHPEGAHSISTNIYYRTLGNKPSPFREKMEELAAQYPGIHLSPETKWEVWTRGVRHKGTTE